MMGRRSESTTRGKGGMLTAGIEGGCAEKDDGRRSVGRGPGCRFRFGAHVHRVVCTGE